MPKNTLINYKDVCFSYKGTQILFDINININKGDSVAIVGHNGAGKTTLIKLLVGVLTPDSGHVETVEYVRTNKLSFMPENAALYAHLRGIDLMRYFAQLKNADIASIDKILALVEIKFAANKKIANYSKGMKQRLMLAQALLSDPEILILDEPYSGLDPNSRRLFSKILQNLSQQGKSIILSSHTLEGLSDIVDNVVFINEGKVTLFGNIDKVVRSLNLNDRIEITPYKDNSIDKIIKPIEQLIESYELIKGKLVVSYKAKQNMVILKRITRMDGIKDIDIIKANVSDVYQHLYNKNYD